MIFGVQLPYCRYQLVTKFCPDVSFNNRANWVFKIIPIVGNLPIHVYIFNNFLIRGNKTSLLKRADNVVRSSEDALSPS